MAINPNKTSKILITGTSEADSIKNYGYQVTISTGNGNDTVHNDYDHHFVSPVPSSVSIDTGEGNDYVKNDIGRYVTINAGVGNDYVYNDSGSYCTINTGSGNDSVYNYHDWNSTINTGAGNDFISLNSSSSVIACYNMGDGNDIIYGFSGRDTLSIVGGSYSTKKSGDNIIVTVGDGKISLMGATSLSKLNIKGTKATTTKLTVTNSTKSPMTVGSAIKTINASSRTKAVKITGNSLANTITGGSGKDSLYGGKGNDSILGGKGNDTFIYKAGEGTDKIFDYSSGDMLKILKANGKTGSFSKSKYSGGTLSLTVSGGGSVLFDNVTTSTDFNINGTSYKISGSKLVKK